ncbi:family 16 glycoside hydrolase [Galbibacter sp. BG1]
MKRLFLLLYLGCFIGCFAQETMTWNSHRIIPVNVVIHSQQMDEILTIERDIEALPVPANIIDGVDEPTFAKLTDTKFHNGTIEVEVYSELLANAPEYARGFLGIAFRINDANTAFESIYIRPTNGRAKDQLRRNHAVQYFSYPNYKFNKLREESPGVYETYADMKLGQWIPMKIVVKEATAKLYLWHQSQPTLVVNDLKLGAFRSGMIGLWVEHGTKASFRNIKITKEQEQ